MERVNSPILGLYFALLLSGFLTSCNPVLAHLNIENESAAEMTGSRFKSMVFVAKTSAGALIIDLGWLDGNEKVKRGLDRIGMSESDVTAVFLTHSHRDHISGWPAAKNGIFYLGKEEIPLLFGFKEHQGWMAKWPEYFNMTDFPSRGDVRVQGFQNDTTFVVGQDTVRAFKVIGHTAGSSAYLFRRTLFAGDALAHPFWGKYRSAMWGFSDDTDLARENLASLFERVKEYEVDYICTAHAKCGDFDEVLRKEAIP